MKSVVALEDMTDAPMTIPGTLTSLEIVTESRFRMGVFSASEWRRSWWVGMSSFFSWGKRMRVEHFLSASSN